MIDDGQKLAHTWELAGCPAQESYASLLQTCESTGGRGTLLEQALRLSRHEDDACAAGPQALSRHECRTRVLHRTTRRPQPVTFDLSKGQMSDEGRRWRATAIEPPCERRFGDGCETTTCGNAVLRSVQRALRPRSTLPPTATTGARVPDVVGTHHHVSSTSVRPRSEDLRLREASPKQKVNVRLTVLRIMPATKAP